MGRVLGIVYRCIATHLIKKAGLPRRMAQTGAVTLIRRLGSQASLRSRDAFWDIRVPKTHSIFDSH